jgi:hypothetical protein
MSCECDGAASVVVVVVVVLAPARHRLWQRLAVPVDAQHVPVTLCSSAEVVSCTAEAFVPLSASGRERAGLAASLQHQNESVEGFDDTTATALSTKGSVASTGSVPGFVLFLLLAVCIKLGQVYVWAGVSKESWVV